MSSTRPPVTVLIVACLFAIVGVAGLVYHFPGLLAMRKDAVWVELTELLSVVAGVFLFLGHNWARWLAVAWMAFHIAIGFPAMRPVVVHSLIFALITWGIFHPAANRFFAARPRSTE